MRRFAGQKVDGTIFGCDNKVVLPYFSEVKAYTSPDGKIEIDAIGDGEIPWAVEVKWKGKAIGKKELDAFMRKTKSMSVMKLWYVAKAGFTAEAIAYAGVNGIMLSGDDELQRLTGELSA
jgi:hypothetical protein